MPDTPPPAPMSPAQMAAYYAARDGTLAAELRRLADRFDAAACRHHPTPRAAGRVVRGLVREGGVLLRRAKLGGALALAPGVGELLDVTGAAGNAHVKAPAGAPDEAGQVALAWNTAVERLSSFAAGQAWVALVDALARRPLDDRPVGLQHDAVAAFTSKPAAVDPANPTDGEKVAAWVERAAVSGTVARWLADRLAEYAATAGAEDGPEKDESNASGPVGSGGATLTPSAVMDMLGLGTTRTVGGYARQAGVPTPGRGRGGGYTMEQVLAIADVALRVGDRTVRDKAAKAIPKLRQMAIKSPNGNQIAARDN